MYVSENGYLPRDWDGAASAPNFHFPPLPYLAPAADGGICDLISGGLPSLQRTVPDFADVPIVDVDAMKNLSTIDPAPLCQAPLRGAPHGPAAPRDAKVCPKPPPPVFGYVEV